jgi:ribosomal protein S18 acetylase RimI-like enzyme
VIEYRQDAAGVTAAQLAGFFEGWKHPPDAVTHLRLLAGSDLVALAVDSETGEVVGFITAISDGVLSAYIPFLEVRPAYRGRGIGRALVEKMLNRLKDLYMIDLVCDPPLQPFYERCGMQRQAAMARRNYDRQSGTAN